MEYTGRTVLNMSEEELLNTELVAFYELIKVHRRLNSMDHGNVKEKAKTQETFIDNIQF